jgi:hypothetical protein
MIKQVWEVDPLLCPYDIHDIPVSALDAPVSLINDAKSYQSVGFGRRVVLRHWRIAGYANPYQSFAAAGYCCNSGPSDMTVKTSFALNTGSNKGDSP